MELGSLSLPRSNLSTMQKACLCFSNCDSSQLASATFSGQSLSPFLLADGNRFGARRRRLAPFEHNAFKNLQQNGPPPLNRPPPGQGPHGPCVCSSGPALTLLSIQVASATFSGPSPSVSSPPAHVQAGYANSSSNGL